MSPHLINLIFPFLCFRFGFKIGKELFFFNRIFSSLIFRRTKWRKKHAAEIHGPSGKRNKQQRNDGTIPTNESDSNSN